MLHHVVGEASSDTWFLNPQLLNSLPLGDLEGETEKLRNLQKVAQEEG